MPVLNKYKCLEISAEERRRSLWVHAYCDLYHPFGAWGSQKFSNAPDFYDSKKHNNRKYRFKGYQIPAI